MNNKRRAIFLLIGVLFTGTIFYSGFSIGYQEGKSDCPVCKPEDIDFSLFWEAYQKLKDNFVRQDKLNSQTILYGAISGMVRSLEDPYTVFFTPQDAKIFEEDVKGVFEGIGIEIGKRKGQLQVIAPLEGTPAHKAGLKSGDKILKVGDTSTLDLSIEEAVKLIRGPKGTKVVLTVLRDGWDSPKEIEIQRNIIEIPSLKWELKDGNVAYLKLYHFSEKAFYDFRKAAFEIIHSPAQKIVLDLRNNPGGYLEVAQNIAGWFLKEGEVVVVEQVGNGEKREFKSSGPGTFLSYPIVVLINQGSASASEILAGALKDNRNVVLIGERSFGKGSVQSVEKLRDNSSLKITIAYWLTPKGKVLNEEGLEPDIKIEQPVENDEKEQEKQDVQLEKALEVIKKLQ